MMEGMENMKRKYGKVVEAVRVGLYAYRRGPARTFRFEGETNTYYLRENPRAVVSGWSCTCPGFTYRGSCKHVENPSEWLHGAVVVSR